MILGKSLSSSNMNFSFMSEAECEAEQDLTAINGENWGLGLVGIAKLTVAKLPWPIVSPRIQSIGVESLRFMGENRDKKKKKKKLQLTL